MFFQGYGEMMAPAVATWTNPLPNFKSIHHRHGLKFLATPAKMFLTCDPLCCANVSNLEEQYIGKVLFICGIVGRSTTHQTLL